MKRFVVLGVLLVALGGTGQDGVLAQKKPDTSLPPPPLSEIPNLIKKLKDPDAKVRAKSAAGLVARGRLRARDIKEAIVPLVEVLKKDTDADARREAAVALSKADADPEVVLAPLITALKEEKEDKVRAACAAALGALGPAAKDAVEPLREVQAKAKEGGKADRALVQATTAALKLITGGTK